MMIYELKTANGRLFKVAIENNSQKKRLLKAYHDNINSDKYEKFASIKEVSVGIHNIKTFEKLTTTLQ